MPKPNILRILHRIHSQDLNDLELDLVNAPQVAAHRATLAEVEQFINSSKIDPETTTAGEWQEAMEPAITLLEQVDNWLNQNHPYRRAHRQTI